MCSSRTKVDILATTTIKSLRLAIEPDGALRISPCNMYFTAKLHRLVGCKPNVPYVLFSILFRDSSGKPWSHWNLVPDDLFLPDKASIVAIQKMDQLECPITPCRTWDGFRMAEETSKQLSLDGYQVIDMLGNARIEKEGISVSLTVYVDPSTVSSSQRPYFPFRYLLPYERFLFRPGPLVRDGKVIPFGSDTVICHGAPDAPMDLPPSPIEVLRPDGSPADPADTAAWDGLKRIRNVLTPPLPPPPTPPPVPRDVPAPAFPHEATFSEPRRVTYRATSPVDHPAVNRVVRLLGDEHTGLLRLGSDIRNSDMFRGDEWTFAVYDFLDTSGRAWRHWGAFWGGRALFPDNECVVRILPHEEIPDEALDAAGPWDLRWNGCIDDRDVVEIPVERGEPIRVRLKYTGFHARARLEGDHVRIRAALHAPEDPREHGTFIAIEFTKPVDCFLWTRGPRRGDAEEWYPNEAVMLEPLSESDAVALRGLPRSPVEIQEI